VDVWPFLSGKQEKSPRQSFLYYAAEELQAIREGPWKLHFEHEYLTVAGPPGRNGKPASFEKMKPKGIEESGLRGIASRHGYEVKRQGLALYNLNDDIGETRDQAAKNPDIVRQLEAKAEDARRLLGDSLKKRTGTGLRPAGRR
jgi:hypothetical protein